LLLFEGLEEAIEDREEPPTFFENEQGMLVALGSKSDIGSGGEGSEEVEVETNR